MSESKLQPSFASGELAPSLYARTDVAKYQTGLRLCKNFCVMPYGGVRNRPGTTFIGSTKSDGKARLIPFQFNDVQTYVLEFGNLYMRVYKDGGIVLTGGGSTYELVTPFVEADLADLNFTQSADVMTIVHPNYPPKQLSRLDHNNWTLASISFVPSIAAPTGLALSGGGTGSNDSSYKVTAVLDNESLEESLPSTSATRTNHDTLSASTRITITWSSVAGARYYNIYKDDTTSGIFGFLGRAETTTFVDKGAISPAKTDTPPNAENPFVGAGNYPGAVGYYQQRLTFAGSNLSPQTVWMSKTGAFNNFGYATPLKDDDAITFTVASREVNRFRHLLPLRQFIGLTVGAEWVIQGSESGLTAKTVKAEVQSYNGSSKLPPIVINNSAIYVQARGNRVSSLAYSFEQDGFSGEDLTKYSPHLFRGRTLVDWAYQQMPDSLVWVARDDGTLLGMTFLPEEQLVGWHQHSTDGFIESLTSIPEGTEDALYMIVRRTVNGATKRYVERMASRYVADIEDAHFVDCALKYDGRNTTSTKTMTLSGGSTWGYPETVTMTATGHTPFTVGSVGRFYRLRSGSDSVRVEVTAYTSTSVVTVRLVEVCPVALRATATATWALMAYSVSGLGHLEGKTVSILADGDVHPQRTVASGAISLQSPAAVVLAGLPYTAEMETLDIDSPNSETLLDKRKLINSVTAVVEDTRGFWAGADSSHTYEQKVMLRDNYNDPSNAVTGPSQISIAAKWSTAGRVYISQPDPLPTTILALIPEVTVGGRG